MVQFNPQITLSMLVAATVVIANSIETLSRSDKRNTYITSWIGQFLANRTDSFFDPIISQNPPLAVNNLKPTSLANIQHYVHYAFAAYCSDNLVAWTCMNCRILGPNVLYITEVYSKLANAKAFFALDNSRQEIVVSFRGGFNLSNLLLVPNFYKLRVKNSLNIKVHAGFYVGTISIYSKVVKALGKLILANPTYKVVLTGHSKGGAEAALTLLLFKLNNMFSNTSFEMYTYGEPRIGNRAFANYFNSLDIPVARVVNHADIIPHVNSPSSLGYVHHQNEVWIVNDSVKYCSTKRYEDENCSNSQSPPYSMQDHIYYFDADFAVCILEDPVNYALQGIVNLKPYIPQGLLDDLKLNMLNLTPLNTAVLRPLGQFMRALFRKG